MRLAAVTAIIGFVIPAPAVADGPDEVIALSADGVAFARELPAPLFAGARIVPGTTVVRSFWVKNQEPTPGTLALAIQDVSGPEVLVSGLSAAAAVGAATGSVAFADAAPCATILSGVPVPASGAVRVEVALSLADLDGLEAQGSTGEFALRVTLTSAEVPAPPGCTPPGAPPVDPPAPPPGGPANGGDSVVVVGSSGGSDAARPETGDPDAGADDPRVVPEGSPRALGMNGNTDRLYQEYFVAAWLAAALLGGVCAWGWRRRHHEEDA